MKTNVLKKTIVTHHVTIILGLIVLLGLFIRVFHLWDNVIFVYDQARDAQRIMGIITLKHLKLVGPETDIPGVFNGALFYYFLAPLYFISRFNPNGVALVIALLNIGFAGLAFYTAKVLFKNNYVGLLAAFFWAISYEQIAYSHYISNASFMGVAAMLFFLGCALHFLRNNKIGLPLSALGLGIAIHCNFYLVYLVAFYPLFYFLFPQKMQRKSLVQSAVILSVLLLPFALADIQFHFMMTKSLAAYVMHGGGSFGLHTIIDDVSRYKDRITDAVYNSYFSYTSFLAFFLFGFFVVYTWLCVSEKKSLLFLYLWIFSTAPLFVFHSGVLTVQVINSSLQGAFAILIALGIWQLLQNSYLRIVGVIFLLLIIISNILLLQKAHFAPNTFFVSEPMTIGYQKQVIDYTYKEAKGKPFSICAITSPLFINTVWGYLYNWYGKGTYGYVPFWAGLRQDLQQSLLPYDIQHTQLRFLIEEPLVGIPPQLAQATIFTEDHISVLSEKKDFGGIIVEKRMLLPEEERKLIDTQKLSQKEIDNLDDFVSASPLYSCYNTY